LVFLGAFGGGIDESRMRKSAGRFDERVVSRRREIAVLDER
jgi:hypothetical protein